MSTCCCIGAGADATAGVASAALPLAPVHAAVNRATASAVPSGSGDTRNISFSCVDAYSARNAEDCAAHGRYRAMCPWRHGRRPRGRRKDCVAVHQHHVVVCGEQSEKTPLKTHVNPVKAGRRAERTGRVVTHANGHLTICTQRCLQRAGQGGAVRKQQATTTAHFQSLHDFPWRTTDEERTQ